MKVINAPPMNMAEMFSNGFPRRHFWYISVTRPTVEFDMIDVFDKNGNVGKVMGASKWHPVEFEVDRHNYDLVKANCPCNIQFTINKDTFILMSCYVRTDSTDGYLLKIHTNNARMI